MILHKMYTSANPMTKAQVDTVLAIFERTKTQTYCYAYLQQQCQAAHEALDVIPHATHAVSHQAINDMKAIIQFIEKAEDTKTTSL